VSVGLPAVEITSLLVDGSYVYAGTNGKAVLKCLLSRLKGINLFINDLIVYPNPSGDYISIETPYSSTMSQNIISVYDVRGRLIIQQLQKEQKTLLDISRLTNGVYFVKITNGSETLKSKFVKGM
jgi:hypothetical protein